MFTFIEYSWWLAIGIGFWQQWIYCHRTGQKYVSTTLRFLCMISVSAAYDICSITSVISFILKRVLNSSQVCLSLNDTPHIQRIIDILINRKWMYSTIFSTEFLSFLDPQLRVQHTQVRSSWLDCVSSKAGLPKWLLGSALFFSVVSMLYLCCCSYQDCKGNDGKVCI